MPPHPLDSSLPGRRPAFARLRALIRPHRRRHARRRRMRTAEQLRQELRQLRSELHRLRRDHRALAERNAAVEALSAELMRFNIDLSQVSRLDAMTGLLNRAAFEACLTQEHALAGAALSRGRRRPYTVIMLDVDHFKRFNDNLGHPAGDACLVAVARVLQDTVRKTDFVGRYGGEEIIVLCPGLDTPSATHLAERLCEAVRELRILHPASPAADCVTVSIGLATGDGLPDHPHGWNEVVKAADRMLYRAKHTGRNRVAAA